MYPETDQVHYLLSCFQHRNVENDLTACRRLTKKALQLATRGHDTRLLFPAVVKFLASTDLLLKKLACWFVSQHGRQSDLILLAVNTLVKDCQDSSPMVRGLALKTLSSLPQECLADHVVRCLAWGLQDQSAYVRRVATLGCCKLHSLNPQGFQDHGLVDTLYALIRDPDPVVVVNCLLALQEILRQEGGVVINRKMCHFLLGRLETFPEWQLAVVMDILSNHSPRTEEEILDIMNLIDPSLKHSNVAVVIATMKYFLHLVRDMDHLKREVYHRAKPQIVHFLGSGNPELSYMLLEYVDSVLMMKTDDEQPFSEHHKAFFCKYNEPLYVKEKKLSMLPKLTRQENLAEILDELNMYCLDVQEAVGIAALHAIGQIAERFPDFFDPCVDKILELLSLRMPSTTEHVLAVLESLDLRQYRDLSDLLERVSAVQDCALETEGGRCSLVWILGEYGERLDEAPYILEKVVEDSRDEDDVTLRQTLLTSATKLFLKRPGECQETLGQLFEMCLDTAHVQVRDRVHFYYKLLTAGVGHCRDVVLGQDYRPTPAIQDAT